MDLKKETSKPRRWIKSILKESLIFILIFIGLSQGISLWRSPRLASSSLPPMTGRLLNGDLLQLDALQNRPILIYFWATWCSTCRFQSPVIENISKDVQVISIAVGSGSDDEVVQYLKQKQIQFPVLNDPKHRWSRHFKVQAFPTLFLYDARKKLRFTEVGYTSWLGLKSRLWLMDQ